MGHRKTLGLFILYASLLLLGLRPLGFAKRSEARQLNVAVSIRTAEGIVEESYQSSLFLMTQVEDFEILMDRLQMAENHINAIKIRKLPPHIQGIVEREKARVKAMITARRDQIAARVEELLRRSEIRRQA